MELKGFGNVQSGRMQKKSLENDEVLIPEVVEGGLTRKKQTTEIEKTKKTLKEAAAENFDKILGLASDIISIKKTQVQTEAMVAKMEQDRMYLLAESEAYVAKVKADTASVVDKMTIIRYMLQDFYKQSNQQISGADFKEIITSIVEQMKNV